MNPEFEPIDPALEQAMAEIHGDTPDSATIEAAAGRVWARLAEMAPADGPVGQSYIRSCADFQALIPEYRAGRLPEARALLLKDHLHNCVACRHIYEGKVVAFPARPAPARLYWRQARWAAAAAVVVAAAGLSIWIGVDRYGVRTGRAMIQTVNGTLFEVSDAGMRPVAAGQEFRYGVELRTAKDSDAVIVLRDGSVVELRARSGLSTTALGRDTTIHLARGNVIVQAAKRSSGHLYVATADCRVAVTGTVFSVEAGTKGSRVSVIQGRVQVAQNNRDNVLTPGQQSVTGNVEPISVSADIAWSRNRDLLMRSFPAGTRTENLLNPLLDRLPANTAFFAYIPNASYYLNEAKAVLSQRMAENPELRAHFAARLPEIGPMLARLNGASQYLGDEVLVVGLAGNNKVLGPVFVAKTRREGLAAFFKSEGVPATAETRGGLTAFGPDRAAVEAFAPSLDQPTGGFRNSPCYAPAAESSRNGGSLLVCADLSRVTHSDAPGTPRYFLAEQREVEKQMESRATVGFGGPRTGIASWLAAPSPMGSLDYISPEATFVGAFVVKSPTAIVDELLSLKQGSAAAAEKSLEEARAQTGIDIRNDLAASLGGEFALALDGPAIPVPSWKLVTEVYNPSRFQSTLQKIVETYNREAARNGRKPLRTSQEVVGGRTYYMIAAADGGPLLEAHYTFSDGYLVAGPSRALVAHALEVKTNGTSIARSAKFQDMAPRDHWANFSALVYQDLGTTLAPLAGVLSALGGGNPEAQKALDRLGNMKASFIAAYGEPDRITVATKGMPAGLNPFDMLNGGISGIAGNALPMLPFGGTPARRRAY